MSGICDSFSGSIACEVLTFNPEAIPEPDTLHIRMTRGERRIADELRKSFGGFRRVVIDVDGERHEFSADSLIRLLEGYEGSRDELNSTRTISIPSLAFNYVDNRLESIGTGGELYYRERGAYVPDAGTRWHELFGTPERAARTLVDNCEDHHFCEGCPADREGHDCTYDALLEWLRGDAE